MTPSEKNIVQAKKIVESLMNDKTSKNIRVKIKFIHDCLVNKEDLPQYTGKTTKVKVC